MKNIHPTAIVNSEAKLGKNILVGPYAVIEGDVEIGEGATIAPHEVILPKSRIPAGRKPFEKEMEEQLAKKDLPSQDFPQD